jgi:hypothetical protein
MLFLSSYMNVKTVTKLCIKSPSLVNFASELGLFREELGEGSVQGDCSLLTL